MGIHFGPRKECCLDKCDRVLAPTPKASKLKQGTKWVW